MPVLSELLDWQRKIALAVAATLPGLLVRTVGGAAPPVQAALYGAAVVAAAFILAWACEAAQVDIAHGLVVAVVAFVAILPEYVVEMHFAFTGRADYVTANLTGASRLLLGFCVSMPAIAALLPRSWRPERLAGLELAPQHRVELAILGLAAVWSLRIVVRGQMSLLDSVVLIALYALYLRLVSRAEGDGAPLVGVSAALAELPAQSRRRWVGALMGYAGLVILLTAVPFGNAVLGSGALIGISPYLLLQWLVSLATETPELVVRFELLTHGRGGQSAAVLIGAAVSQYM